MHTAEAALVAERERSARQEQWRRFSGTYGPGLGAADRVEILSRWV